MAVVKDAVEYIRGAKDVDARAGRIRERLIVVNKHMPKDSFSEALGYNVRLIEALRVEGVWPPPYVV